MRRPSFTRKRDEHLLLPHAHEVFVVFHAGQSILFGHQVLANEDFVASTESGWNVQMSSSVVKTRNDFGGCDEVFDSR